ncbi:probable E3 SUMO-protein ligase RNF212 isoform X2 [Zootoca vivipara]|uniref:probable E3 SUMO-protein ligase RNF212 isoform X2 n=1 Tax=Zootoca vivipara TaxID=8524 RepID=UPI001591A9FA|nr:probable E3 SUMO-protein ligase RNF212 isoform X2 [Zootoca vivipara]
MAALVFCNACFQKPQRASQKFCLTNCGHVVCEQCLRNGKKDECVICRAPCRTIVLSKKVNSNIQLLFTEIDGLCKTYSKEITQIAHFQEKHRRRLLANYKGKITKLEGYLKKATQQMQHKQQVQQSSPMEADYVPSSVRKTETAAGPTRISLISPPQNGHMGSVTWRSSQLSGMTSSQSSTSGSVRSLSLRMPNRETSYMSPFVSTQNNRDQTPDGFGQRTMQHYRCTSTPSHSSVTRHPISLPNLLQRQNLGSTSLPGHSLHLQTPFNRERIH